MDWMLGFLKELERIVPPPIGCHHAITYAQYGSDLEGWVDKLALQINRSGNFSCWFIEPEDMVKTPSALAIEIGELLRANHQNGS